MRLRNENETAHRRGKDLQKHIEANGGRAKRLNMSKKAMEEENDMLR